MATAAQQESFLEVTKSPVERHIPRPIISDEDRAIMESGQSDVVVLFMGRAFPPASCAQLIAELHAFDAAYGVGHTLKAMDHSKRHRNKARMEGLKQQLSSMSKQLGQLKSVASGMEKDFAASTDVSDVVGCSLRTYPSDGMAWFHVAVGC